MGKIFHIGQTAISMKIKRNPMLAKSLSDKTNISSINEILSGKMTDALREGLQLKYSFMANPYFSWALLGVVIIALIIGFIWLRYRKK
jgi:hypothetical protein